jgi:hypothetical protein
MDNPPNLNLDELSAYASAKHLAGVPDDEIYANIVRMLKEDGWKEAAITPMMNEVARRTKGVAETRGSPRSPPKSYQNATAEALSQLAQLLAPVTARLETLEQRASQTPQTPTPQDSCTRETPLLEPTYAHRKLPDPERFDGSRANYTGWRFECEGKLVYDAGLFPTEDAKIRYILSRTKDKANQALLPWILSNKYGTVQDLWEHMDTQFKDVHQEQRALNKLRHLKQGRRPVRDYVSEFNQLRVESGQEYSRPVLREMFSEGLNAELQRLLLLVPKDVSFKQYTDKAIEVADDLYRLNLNSRPKGAESRTAQFLQPSNRRKHVRTPSPPDKMDWEPTRVSKAQSREKRPATRSIVCFYCTEPGHGIKDCPLKKKADKLRVGKAIPRPSPIEDKGDQELASEDDSDDQEKA